MKEKALAKLAAEFDQGTYFSHERQMKQYVRDALETFIRQDEEFAQAVVQDGTFSECMKAVAKDCGACLSDLEAYKRAVQFYFPGADVEFQMKIRVNPHESGADDSGNDNGGDNAKDNGGITLNFADLFA